MSECGHKKVRYLQDTATPNFLYCVIRETNDTVTLGWQTRGWNWNETTVPRDQIEFETETK